MKSTLMNYVELQAEKAESLSFCRGIKLLHIRDKVEEMLSFIGKGGIFEEYTKHNIDHIDEMLKIIEWIIPDETKKNMTAAEWLMLTLAVYFHDLGMVVTKEEYLNRDKTYFKTYKDSVMHDMKDSEYIEYIRNQDDHFMYQEFVRENHARRIRQWIENKRSTDMGDASTVTEVIEEILKNIDKMFKVDLAMICESHHLDDIDDFSKYKVNKMYGNDSQEKVNLNYIAIILRIADLLHITKDRTPSITRKLINVSNPVSVVEWEKQMAVKAVQPQAKRNEEGAVDESRPKDTIEITAYFDGAETADAYFGLSSYLQYTRKELAKCSGIVEKAQKKEGTINYQFPWKDIDESQIEVIGFEPKKLQFTIAQENILQLLVGHTLYNDSSVVVRELVQNGIDAVRLQKQIDVQNRVSITEGKIQVDWNNDKRELTFWDNGTGMSIHDVENYLLKVGASKYREDFIKKQFPDFCSISHFGIGILTCFMIANDIDIITNSEEQNEANCINLRKVNGSYLLRKVEKMELDRRIQKHGTMVKLYVRNDVDMSKVEDDLRKWIVLPEIPVYLTYSEVNSMRIGYDSLKDVLIKYLNEQGYSVDGEEYDVYEKVHGNVTVAYAIRHLKYMSDWCLMSVDRRRISRKSMLPIGTCVEGIRVEFTTPGYKNESILAIANIKNSKFQTNVARSAIELEGNNEILSDIYDIFQEYIQEQMDGLEQQDYSKTWALFEAKYLMRPLLADEFSSYRTEPVDEEILIQRLAKLKCLSVENGNERKNVSAVEVSEMDEVNIFECKMIQAAEYLLREIRSGATLKNLIGVVCPEDNFLESTNNVICNYDRNNMLHQYALRNKEVTKINVNHKKRRIHLAYTAKSDIWYQFELRNRSTIRNLYVPKKEFLIAGLEDEIGVKTNGGIFIRSDTSMYKYLIKIIDSFLMEDTDENRILLEVFLSSVFDSKVLEHRHKRNVNTNSIFKQLLEDRFLRVNDELLEKLWSKIDSDEFVKVVLAQNYSLYSIDNWSRTEDSM